MLLILILRNALSLIISNTSDTGNFSVVVIDNLSECNPVIYTFTSDFQSPENVTQILEKW